MLPDTQIAAPFKPGNNINRQEITTMMYRYAKYQGYSLEGGADYSSYPDAANVQEFGQRFHELGSGQRHRYRKRESDETGSSGQYSQSRMCEHAI